METHQRPTCACGCGFTLWPAMTVIWLKGEAYAARCLTMGSYSTPEKTRPLHLS